MSLRVASTASSRVRPRRDIEPRFVTPSVEGPEYDGKGWRMAPEGVAEKIDDHTIGVVVIMGNHYSGHYEPVAEIAAAVRAANAAKGLNVEISA